MKVISHTIIILCSLYFSSCISTYGDNIMRRYSQLKPDTSHLYPADKPILLFFEGEPVSFEYDRLGLVEVTGDQNASTSDLLNHLRYEAMKNNGNAVIAVKDGYATRKSGVLFSKTPPTEYSSHIYSGIAVRLKDRDNLLINAYNNQNDTTFIGKVRKYDISYSRRSGLQLGASLLLGVFLAGLIIYFLVTK